MKNLALLILSLSVSLSALADSCPELDQLQAKSAELLSLVQDTQTTQSLTGETAAVIASGAVTTRVAETPFGKVPYKSSMTDAEIKAYQKTNSYQNRYTYNTNSKIKPGPPTNSGDFLIDMNKRNSLKGTKTVASKIVKPASKYINPGKFINKKTLSSAGQVLKSVLRTTGKIMTSKGGVITITGFLLAAAMTASPEGDDNQALENNLYHILSVTDEEEKSRICQDIKAGKISKSDLAELDSELESNTLKLKSGDIELIYANLDNTNSRNNSKGNQTISTYENSSEMLDKINPR